MHANLYACPFKLTCSRGFVLFLSLFFMIASALAEKNDHLRSKKSEAELHIRVHVVPVVMRPPHKKHREDSSISYNLIDQKQNMDIKEEIHPLVGITGSGGATNAVLKTVTIVLQ